MTLFNLVGDDTFIINDRPIQFEFADGDTCTIDFPTEKCTMTTGKDGNTIYALNAAGTNFDCVFTVMRGGNADKFLNGLQSQQDRDFVAFPLMNGSFTKRVGDGEGNVHYDTYTLRGMVFTKNVPVKGNVSGDAEQGKSTYTLKGATTVRGIA